MSTRSYPSWGDDIAPEARAQMDAALALPVALAGALMPDAHVGYGLPIGGVLATDNAVIPYGVGVDIACRMMMTVFDVPPDCVEGTLPRARSDRAPQRGNSRREGDSRHHTGIYGNSRFSR